MKGNVGPRRGGKEDDAPRGKKKKKKTKNQEEFPWNQNFEAAFSKPLPVANSPGLLQIKPYCRLAAGDPVLQNTFAMDCCHYLLMGCCAMGHCASLFTALTDCEVIPLNLALFLF